MIALIRIGIVISARKQRKSVDGGAAGTATKMTMMKIIDLVEKIAMGDSYLLLRTGERVSNSAVKGGLPIAL